MNLSNTIKFTKNASKTTKPLCEASTETIVCIVGSSFVVLQTEPMFTVCDVKIIGIIAKKLDKSFNKI